MSKDIDRIISDVYKKQEELNKFNIKSNKDLSIIQKDIDSLKREVKNISSKIDLILDILNNFTLMVLDEEEAKSLLDDEDDYDNGWIPEQNEEWNSYEDDELDD